MDPITMALIVSAVGNIGASIKSAQEAKKAEAEIGKQQGNLQNWYDITANRDYTKTAEAQSAITAARDLMQQQYLAGKGAAAVSGASDAEAARLKASANDAMVKTVDNIAARGSAIKQDADSKYLAGMQTLSEKRSDLAMEKAKNIQKAGENLSNAAGNVATGLFGV